MQSLVRRKAEAEIGRQPEKSNCHYCQGRWQSSLKTFHQALAAYQINNDPVGQANTLKYIGLVHYNLGEYAWALKCLLQALRFAQVIGNRKNEGVILYYIGAAYRQTGQRRQALKVFYQALAAFKDIEDRVSIAYILNHLGEVCNSLGQSARAHLCCRHALKVFQSLDNLPNGYSLPLATDTPCCTYTAHSARHIGEGAALYNIGEAYFQQGRLIQALVLFEQALALRQKVGERNSLAITLESIGSVYVRLNREQRALDCYQQALEICRGVDESPKGDRYTVDVPVYVNALRTNEARILDYIGAVHYKLGNHLQALWYHLKANKIWQALNHTADSEKLLHHLGGVYDRLGLHHQGIKCYEQALELVRTFGEKAIEHVQFLCHST